MTVISGGTDKTPSVGSGGMVSRGDSYGGEGLGVDIVEVSSAAAAAVVGAGLTVISCIAATVPTTGVSELLRFLLGFFT